MDKPQANKFFRVTANSHSYKVFMDDVAVIYRAVLRHTPPLTPYYDGAKHAGDDTD